VAAGFCKPLEEALAYRCDEVPARFAREHGASRADAELLFVETKRWLWACARAPRRLLVTPELAAIDGMWHCFLLFTREYQRFCLECLGEFIHHDPLTNRELEEFAALREADPGLALERRRAELRPQLELLYDLLGPETVSRWYQDFPVRFAQASTIFERKWLSSSSQISSS
jgi:hypothetical protein